jgi:hypothetical protein
MIEGTRMKAFLAALAFVGGGLVAVPASGRTLTVSIIGEGNESCGTWTVDRQSGQSLNDQAWASGFLSGEMSFYGAIKNVDVELNTDTNGLFGWLDNYCKANPTDNLEQAVVQFWHSSDTIKVGP